MQYNLENCHPDNKQDMVDQVVNSDSTKVVSNNKIRDIEDMLTKVSHNKIINLGILDTSEKAIRAKEKATKQLLNMYKNTKMAKYCIQVHPVATKLEFKRVKGLILNISKRLSWYLDTEEDKIKCLLMDTKAKSCKTDLTEEDKRKGFFVYYAKAIYACDNETKFVVVPLYDLNIVVV